ncbi:MAG: hypothetical protein ABIN01_01185 [Ferruginibacter sp.]
MKIFKLLFLCVWLLSCDQKTKENNHDCENLTVITDELYNVVLNYQKSNPIPKKEIDSLNLPVAGSLFKYIYEVEFTDQKETLVTICLRPNGVRSNLENPNDKLHGVFAGSCLKPTYFRGNKNLMNNFIKANPVDNNLPKFQYESNDRVDIFYVCYIYILVGNKLILKEKTKGNIGH